MKPKYLKQTRQKKWILEIYAEYTEYANFAFASIKYDMARCALRVNLMPVERCEMNNLFVFRVFFMLLHI